MTNQATIERRARAGLVLAAFVLALPAAAGERSFPVDCWPDRVVAWNPAGANPDALFGAAFLPGTVLGPPGDSVAYQGSLTVATTGFGGSVVVGFDDVVIEDRPGPDFIVFENAFFRLPLPATADDDFRVFVEPASVEVSDNGVDWHAFAYDAAALADATGVPDVDRDLFERLTGLAGITPTFSGNWTLANEPAVFDPLGPGGVSGAGGDAFDLADVGLAEARFVRLTDMDTRNGFPGTAEGFDLDTVVVLHGRPLAGGGVDGDGDGLSDLAEERWYGSHPGLADSDGDGTDDGREVAGCRDPGSFDDAPWHHREPRLWIVPFGPCDDVRWSFLGTGVTYDLLRGEVAGLSETGIEVDLGLVECVAGATSTLRFCDSETTPVGAVRFYVARAGGSSHYGHSSRLNERSGSAGCP